MAFYHLLPLGMVANWCAGVAMASVVLQTLYLAKETPRAVLLMPQALRLLSPDALAGGLLVFLSLFGGLAGALAGLLADRRGLKSYCGASIALQAASSLLVAFTPTYLVGLLVFSAASGASSPLIMALFTCQFEDDRLTQRLTTYLYMAQNFAFLLANVAAGVQPYWAGWLECAVLLLASDLWLLRVSRGLRGSSVRTKAANDAERPGVAPRGDSRVLAFAALCPFTLLFFAVFLQFLGGPFVVFAEEQLAPIHGRRVPPQWFLALNGLADLVLGAPLAWLFERACHVRFHHKFRLCFLLMTLACGILSLAARLRPAGGVNPLVPVAAMLLVSLGELSYNPVMLAAISTEMPPDRVGLFTGIHFFLGGAGSALAGVGVPCYRAMGPQKFFVLVCIAAAMGAAGLQVIVPCLDRWLDRAAVGELQALRPKRPAAPGSENVC